MVGTVISSPAGVEQPEAEQPPQTPLGVRELLSTSPMRMPDEYASVSVLKQWPIVSESLEKCNKVYQSVKQKSGIISCSLGLAESFAKASAGVAFSILKKIPFLVEQADIIANDSLVYLEKRYPIVKESPEKVCEAIKKKASSIFEPIIKEFKLITEIGRDTLKKSAKYVTATCRKVVAAIDDWVNKIGCEIQEPSKPTAAAAEAAPTPGSAPADAPWHWRLLGAGLAAARTAAFLQIGLSVWALSRAPLVGRLFAPQPPTSPQEQAGPSKAPSPVHHGAAVTESAVQQ